MLENEVLAKLMLQGTHLGVDGVTGLSRGLVANTTLVALDVSGCDLGARGAAALADALPTCGLEELNVSDNRIGDEGMVALAERLGAPPADGMPLPAAICLPTVRREASKLQGSPGCETDGREGVTHDKARASKYRESLDMARSSILELNPMVLASLTDSDSQLDPALLQVKANFEKLSGTIDRSSPIPRLRVLNIANNGGTPVGVGRLEDALQVNNCLERLVLDHCDHRAGVRALLGALPVNRSLKHLSLASCRISQAASIELAKVLPLCPVLESLCLRGNEVSQTAAAALGGVLSLATQRLRSLNLNSCHLNDESGTLLANGLCTNKSLEVLQLRDNALRESSGRAFVEMMRKHTILVVLNLELNSIDVRFLMQIAQLLERNAKLKEKARPDQYRRRIDQLEECQRRVDALSDTLRHNDERKAQACREQVEAQQDLLAAKTNEKRKGQQLEARLEELRRSRREVDGEVASLEEMLRKVTGEGEYEVSQLLNRLASVDERIGKHERRIEQAKAKLSVFEERAGHELAAAQEELDKAQKGKNSASLLASAAQRNLDSYTSSLKAIEENVSGGADPRRRFVEKAVRQDRASKRPQSGERARTGLGRKAKSSSRPSSAKAGSAKVLKSGSAGLSPASGSDNFGDNVKPPEPVSTAATAQPKRPRSGMPSSRSIKAS
eukprot:SRR837773.22288.p1 GENE.SRR837773.22288~~SRR837773.22288.p1  ORF type:complete len:674 (-),score=89.47 SRR837773.22288:74-2095(-)